MVMARISVRERLQGFVWLLRVGRSGEWVNNMILRVGTVEWECADTGASVGAECEYIKTDGGING